MDKNILLTAVSLAGVLLSFPLCGAAGSRLQLPGRVLSSNWKWWFNEVVFAVAGIVGLMLAGIALVNGLYFVHDAQIALSAGMWPTALYVVSAIACLFGNIPLIRLFLK